MPYNLWFFFFHSDINKNFGSIIWPYQLLSFTYAMRKNHRKSRGMNCTCNLNGSNCFHSTPSSLQSTNSKHRYRPTACCFPHALFEPIQHSNQSKRENISGRRNAPSPNTSLCINPPNKQQASIVYLIHVWLVGVGWEVTEKQRDLNETERKGYNTSLFLSCLLGCNFLFFLPSRS